jgi:Protein of unknown function (DUF3592)
MSDIINAVGTLLFAGFIFFGACWTVLAWFVLSRSRRTARWPQTTGTIIASDVKRVESLDPDSAASYEPHIRYAYSVSGRDYENDTITLNVQVTNLVPRGAEAIRNRYPVGSQVVVFYNPSAPENSVLVRGSAKGNVYFVWFGLVFMAIGIIGLVVR